VHWFLVRKGVDFKIATLVNRSLSGMAPAYLAADCQLSSEEGRRQLRSADSRTCVVSNFGDRCFTAAGPRLWNSLPAGLRQTDIGYEQFCLSGCWRLICLGVESAANCDYFCFNCASRNCLTYLHYLNPHIWKQGRVCTHAYFEEI